MIKTKHITGTIFVHTFIIDCFPPIITKPEIRAIIKPVMIGLILNVVKNESVTALDCVRHPVLRHTSNIKNAYILPRCGLFITFFKIYIGPPPESVLCRVPRKHS